MINSKKTTYQLHATDEGQGAPATTAPHGVLLPLSPVIQVEQKLWVKLPNPPAGPSKSKKPSEGPSGWLAAQVEALAARPQRTECSPCTHWSSGE
ncbi:hypothetical protein CesoFtcFv8_023142 [Champsocephalus esox]|uniref:Uncharacterized protein n=1 Tax=Champsocephalus esox TaxID=159716 RepID=A0AAN8B7M6_9TELE|nr:hypothetical protein CesoFtcFv8_023142 [Champsocephalus esox]